MLKNAVSIVIMKNENVALIRRKNIQNCEDLHELPGGMAESGEHLEEAAVRKTLKKTGIVVRGADLERIGSYDVKIVRDGVNWDVCMTLYSCNKPGGYLKSENGIFPLWANILKVVSGKYRIAGLSESLEADVKKLLKKHYFSTGVGATAYL